MSNSRKESLSRARAVRQQLKSLRQELRDGTLTLTELFDNPPWWLRNYSILEIARLPREYNRHRDQAMVVKFGADAVEAGVNVLKPVVQASPEDLDWLRGWFAVHGARWSYRRVVRRVAVMGDMI